MFFPAGSDAYLQRVKELPAPSMTSLKEQQLDPRGPLVNNWRPTRDDAGGLLPELIHPVFARALDIMASCTKVDELALEIAAKLCRIGGDLYENEVGMHFERQTIVVIANMWSC